MRIKVCYILSDIDKALAFEWTALGLHKKFNLYFVLIGKNESQLSKFLQFHQIHYYEICDSRYSSWIEKWLALFFILKNNRPDIVHTHLWKANLLGLTTSWLLRINQRVYTRHHATTHYYEYPSGRKWDKLCNALATDIIAISKNTEEILIDWDKAKASKVRLIHHGFDFSYFTPHNNQSNVELSSRYNLTSKDYPVIGVISRYVEWKGIQFIIPAFKKLRERFPMAKLILANANGEYKEMLKKQLEFLPSDSYLEIKFESDLINLYKLFDVFVHVPIDPYVEAFGQTYIEPLIVGIPSVFTLSGIAKEFARHKENAWIVNFKNSDEIEEGIAFLLLNEEMRMNIIKNGKKAIQGFSLDQYLFQLEKLYSDQ